MVSFFSGLKNKKSGGFPVMSIAQKKGKNQQKKDIFTENDELKRKNAEVSEYMADMLKSGIISDTTFQKVSSCADFMRFLHGVEVEAGTGVILKEDKKVVTQASFCQNRFCPRCSKGKAQKDAVLISTMTKYFESSGYAFIFLTLTVPNCQGKVLSKTLSDMGSAFNLFMKYDQIQKAVKGYIRKTEVTYNKKTDSYHPHFHCLLAVRKSYFSSRDYIKRDGWLALWQKATKDPSICQVDVRRAGKNGMEKAILELSKYMAKDSDYKESIEVFRTFYLSLKGKRLIVYGGCFKQARQMYEAGGLDAFKRQSYTEVEDYVTSRWHQDDKEYENRVMRSSTLSDEDIDFINERLKKRKRILSRLDDGSLICSYVGRTTYGEDEDTDF